MDIPRVAAGEVNGVLLANESMNQLEKMLVQDFLCRCITYHAPQRVTIALKILNTVESSVFRQALFYDAQSVSQCQGDIPFCIWRRRNA